MEQESVKRLSQAIGSNKIEQVKETVRGELRSKIDRLPIDATLQGELLSAVSRLLYPVQPKASLGAITVATGAPAEKLMPVIAFVSAGLLILIGKFSLVLAFCLAAIAVFGFSKWFGKSLNRPAPEPRLLLEGSPEQLSEPTAAQTKSTDEGVAAHGLLSQCRPLVAEPICGQRGAGRETAGTHQTECSNAPQAVLLRNRGLRWNKYRVIPDGSVITRRCNDPVGTRYCGFPKWQDGSTWFCPVHDGCKDLRTNEE